MTRYWRLWLAHRTTWALRCLWAGSTTLYRTCGRSVSSCTNCCAVRYRSGAETRKRYWTRYWPRILCSRTATVLLSSGSSLIASKLTPKTGSSGKICSYGWIPASWMFRKKSLKKLKAALNSTLQGPGIVCLCRYPLREMMWPVAFVSVPSTDL